MHKQDHEKRTNLHKWYRNWACERKKIPGVIFSGNLKWNAHIGEIVPKANKRLFFLRLLNNAFLNREDLIDTYTSLIRPIVGYACPYGMLVCLNTCRRRWKPFKGELWLQSMGWHNMKNICVQVVWYPSKTDVLKCDQFCSMKGASLTINWSI